MTRYVLFFLFLTCVRVGHVQPHTLVEASGFAEVNTFRGMKQNAFDASI